MIYLFQELDLISNELLHQMIFVVCMILLRKVKMNPIWVMVLAGVMKVGMSLI